MTKTLVPELHNPWRESLFNCTTGNNYLRASEYHKLIAELDRLYAIEAQACRHEVSEGFYLASFKHPTVGGEVLWWRPDNAGYTSDLNMAGVYTEITPGYHDSDYTVPVPVEFVNRAHIKRCIDPGWGAPNMCFRSAEALRAALVAALEEP